MLNGGLSPLRFDRKTVESKTAADLRIKSTGLTAASFLNNYPGDRTTAILRSLPPKVCCTGFSAMLVKQPIPSFVDQLPL